MENLKKTPVLFCVAAALLFSQASYAGAVEEIIPVDIVRTTNDIIGTGAANMADQIPGTITQVGGNLEGGVEIAAEHRAASMVKSVYKQINLPLTSNTPSLVEEKLNASPVEQTVSGVQSALKEVGEFAVNKCEGFSKLSSSCCNNPDSCGKKVNFQEIAGTIGMLGSLLGGGGGAAKCLGALPTMAKGLTGAKSASKSCRILRDGGNISFENNRSAQVIGCVDLCGLVVERINNIKGVARGLLSKPSTAIAAQQLIAEAGKLEAKYSKARNQCGKSLAQGEGNAKAQESPLQSAIQGAMKCAAGMKNGEEVAVADKAVDCSNLSDAQQNPSLCKGFGGAGGRFDDLVNKTSGLDLNTGTGGFEEEPDDSVFNNKTGDGADDVLGKTGEGKAVVAQLGGAGSGSGAAQKAGARGRGRPKGKKLVSGYKTSRGGGGGSYGSRSPSAKRFRSRFKKFKKKADKDKAALAALSKLFAAKMGASPDQSEDIFARVSKRFSISTAKEKMFDCKRNKKLWMER